MKAGLDYIGVAVGTLIFNEKGELFLSKRSQNTRNERGCWEAPGGKIEFGEKQVDAAKREIKEEYGIEIEIIEQFPAVDHLLPHENQHWVATTFIAKIIKGEPRILEPEKCDGIGWFELTKLPKPLSIITKLDINEYLIRKK